MNNFNLLFDSGSLEVADLNNAFWLTSGYLTPMYINTHYICGGSQKSKEILALIDSEYKQDKDFLVKLKQIFTDVYITDNIYKTAIDKLVQHLKPIIKDLDISMIAGGARRDWFFSVLAAEQLNIPHVYIDKELNITDISDNQVLYLSNQRILNIADLLMLGTSCVNYWKPAIEKLNGNLVGSISIVNRMQGGSENLERNNIKSISSLIEITPDFFKSAKDSSIITASQLDIILNYLEKPVKTMKAWLETNPKFLENAKMDSSERVQKRVKLLINNKLYD